MNVVIPFAGTDRETPVTIKPNMDWRQALELTIEREAELTEQIERLTRQRDLCRTLIRSVVSE